MTRSFTKLFQISQFCWRCFHRLDWRDIRETARRGFQFERTNNVCECELNTTGRCERTRALYFPVINVRATRKVASRYRTHVGFIIRDLSVPQLHFIFHRRFQPTRGTFLFDRARNSRKQPAVIFSTFLFFFFFYG